MAKHLDFGRNGELLAKNFLESAGYEILDENWTFGKTEIDLIAYRDKTIIFVEVKTRSYNTFGEPEEFVGIEKERQMDIAAEEYINMTDFEGEIRFDIISILFDRTGQYSLRHIEDAFWPE